MTLTPRATTDDNISAPIRRLILFPAAMSVYPFDSEFQNLSRFLLRFAADFRNGVDKLLLVIARSDSDEAIQFVAPLQPRKAQPQRVADELRPS
jgi:hypothetical protein